LGKKINGNTLHDIAGERGTVLAIEGFEELASSLKKVKNKVCVLSGFIINLMQSTTRAGILK